MIYPFRMYKETVEEHTFFVAESAALKGCVGQGDTPEEALNELSTNEAAWIECANEMGIAY